MLSDHPGAPAGGHLQSGARLGVQGPRPEGRGRAAQGALMPPSQLPESVCWPVPSSSRYCLTHLTTAEGRALAFLTLVLQMRTLSFKVSRGSPRSSGWQGAELAFRLGVSTLEAKLLPRPQASLPGVSPETRDPAPPSHRLSKGGPQAESTLLLEPRGAASLFRPLRSPLKGTVSREPAGARPSASLYFHAHGSHSSHAGESAF